MIAWFFAVASAAEPMQWTVTVDPLTFALGLAHVQVERRLARRWSLYVGPSLHVYDGLAFRDDPSFQGFGVEIGVRGFFTGDAPRGGWVMVRGVGAALSIPGGPSAPGGYGSVLVGGTGIVGPGLVLSGGLGVSGFHYAVGDVGVTGPLPAAHTNVGWAF
jgi:hypothetical protein